MVGHDPRTMAHGPIPHANFDPLCTRSDFFLGNQKKVWTTTRAVTSPKRDASRLAIHSSIPTYMDADFCFDVQWVLATIAIWKRQMSEDTLQPIIAESLLFCTTQKCRNQAFFFRFTLTWNCKLHIRACFVAIHRTPKCSAQAGPKRGSQSFGHVDRRRLHSPDERSRPCIGTNRWLTNHRSQMSRLCCCK